MANQQAEAKKMKVPKSTLTVLLLAVAALGLLAAGFIQLPGLTVLSVSQVEIDPQGYEDEQTGEWRGSKWIITMTVDAADQVAGIKFANDAGEPGKTYVESSDGSRVYASDTVKTGDKVVPQSTITIRIDPDKPFWDRELEIQQGYYTPETWGTWSYKGTTHTKTLGGKMDGNYHASAVAFQHYEWKPGNWVLHTPFTVTVLKDGVEVDRERIDTVGATKSYEVGGVYITDLGKLGHGYGEPQMGEVLYFSQDEIFQADETSRNYVTSDGGQKPHYDGAQWGPILGEGGYNVYGVDSYSTYWYGYGRWGDGSEAPSETSLKDGSPLAYNHQTLLESRRGWRDVYYNFNDGTNRRGPYTPPVLPGDKTAETKALGDMCVTEWLEYKGVQKARMPGWLDGMERVGNHIRLYLPWRAVSSVITVEIPTELADTIVWQPLVANFQITEFPDLGDIADEKTSYVKVKCVDGEGSGAVRFTFKPDDLPGFIGPVTMGTPSMTAGQEETLPFTVTNLGTPEKRCGEIVATIENVRFETDTETAKVCFLIKTGEVTILTVVTTYKGTLVSGIPIIVRYAEQTKTGTTDMDGGASFSLASYAGAVQVSSLETEFYQAMSVTANVERGRQNVVTLELLKHGEEPWPWWLALLALPVFVAMIWMFTRKKRGRKR